jgi:hypothetical protein
VEIAIDAFLGNSITCILNLNKINFNNIPELIFRHPKVRGLYREYKNELEICNVSKGFRALENAI